MAALPTTRLNLADLQKMMDPQGRVAPITELLVQKNDALMDIPWQPGNLPTGHQFSMRTALPTASLRDYNEGVAPSKSAVAQATEGMSIIEAWSEVDAAEVKLNGNEAAFRAAEDAAFTQALYRKLAQLLIYGNSATDAKEFNGFATRVKSTGLQNFIDCGGTGSDNTSIFLSEWGDNLFGIYPLGSEAGLQNINIGRMPLQFSDGTRMMALMSQMIWNCGLVARDPRAIVRAGNIDVSDLKTRANTQAVTTSTSILYAMSDMLYRLPDGMGGTKVFYCNRTVHASLAKIALDRSQDVVTIQSGLNQFGHARQWTTFLGVPIRPMDQILNTEARVTA